MHQFKWPLYKKSALLLYIWCYKSTDDKENDWWIY